MKSLTMFLIMGLSTSVLLAQKTSSGKASNYSVSVVCVGNTSDSEWKGVDGAMVAEATDAGAVPPKNLALVTNAKKDSKPSRSDKKIDFLVSLNLPSKHTAISSNVVRLYSKHGTGQKVTYKNLASTLLPEKMNPYSVILSRDPSSDNWAKPKVLAVSDGNDAFPDGSVRVVNVSDRTLKVQLDGEQVEEIEPEHSIVLKGVLAQGEDRQVSLEYMNKDRVEIAMRRRFKAGNLRTSIVCYQTVAKSKPIASVIFNSSSSK